MKKLILIIFLAVLTLGLYNCGGAPKPEQELNLAKQKLEIAQSEEAPSYTPNEFNEALSNYISATNASAQGKNDVAKQKALSSISNSDIAIAKTRQLKSEKALATFGDLLKEAEGMKADILIPEKFEQYKKAYEVSESLHKQSMYQDSYTNSKEVLPSLESDVNELRIKWNNAREELKKAIDATEDPFYTRAKKRLTNETAEIENVISEAKTLLDQAKLDESIQKSKEALEKIKGLVDIIKKTNEEYLNETGNKLKELKINRNPIFMHFGKKIKMKEFKIAQVINIYENEEGSFKVEEKDISQMTYEELTNYKSKLESEMSNLKSEIKELYNSAQIDYSNGEYLSSMETLDKVNELISQYSKIQNTYNKVVSEIDKRTKIKVVEKPSETYKVKKGDFLSKIATKLFNGGYWWWPKIFVLNKDKISDPDLINEGIELKVPTSLPE